jgi:RHS repeat-associated protein
MKSSGTLYWNSPDGTPLAETNSSGTTLNEYIFFNGNRIARRDPSGNVYYCFQDQLGTTKNLTTSAGVVCYDADFLPFGYESAYTTTCAQNYKFTGLERDSETGNDHTLHRMYESSLGRWLSPDPLGGDITNPQSLNRYAYVLNNATSLTDPMGLDAGDPMNCSVSEGSLDGGEYTLKCSPEQAAQTNPTGGGGSGSSQGQDGSVSDTTPGDDDASIGPTVITSTPDDNASLTLPNTTNCKTGFGFGGQVGADAAAGVGAAGVAVEGSAGAGVFFGGNQSVSAGAYASGGATAYAGSNTKSDPAPTMGPPTVALAGFGAGGGAFFTNATSASQLRGPFLTFGAGASAGLVGLGVQLSLGKDAAGNNIWQFSISYAAGYGAYGYSMTTKTKATGNQCH